ncbi:MAG: carboxypeptidase-like regulatory domain-containing protein [Kofleriaceae bacterium]
MRRLVLITLAGGLACRGGAPPLHPAGSGHDDGHGELSRAALGWSRGEDREPIAAEPVDDEGESGGETYGGAVPPWEYTTSNRVKYPSAANLSGSIEGVVSWRGAVPAKRTSACGPVEVIRIGEGRGVADVLVYIERVRSSRALPNDGRPTSVGGVVVKRGCALRPAVQIVTPLPAALVIHGDHVATRLRVTAATGGPKLYELQEAGRVAMQVQPGVTRVDSAQGELGASWVVAIDTPYYAVTDDAGRFRLDELPPGPYEITIWHAPLPEAGGGKALAYGAPGMVKRSVTVTASRTSRLDVALGR